MYWKRHYLHTHRQERKMNCSPALVDCTTPTIITTITPTTTTSSHVYYCMCMCVSVFVCA